MQSVQSSVLAQGTSATIRAASRSYSEGPGGLRPAAALAGSEVLGVSSARQRTKRGMRVTVERPAMVRGQGLAQAGGVSGVGRSSSRLRSMNGLSGAGARGRQLCRAIFESSRVSDGSRGRRSQSQDEEGRPRRKSSEPKAFLDDDPVFSQLEEASIRLRALEERLADLEHRKTNPRGKRSGAPSTAAAPPPPPPSPEIGSDGFLTKAPASLEDLDALLASLMADARDRALSGSDASTAAGWGAAAPQAAPAAAPTQPGPAAPGPASPLPPPKEKERRVSPPLPADPDAKRKLPPKPKPSRVKTEVPRYRWRDRPFQLPAGGMHQVVRERKARLTARMESSDDILLQGFHWESHKQRWYKVVERKIPLLKEIGVTGVWLPPPSQSVAVEGYLPQNFYSLDSKYGSADDLAELLRGLREAGVVPVADAVLNHRCASVQGGGGKWNRYDGMPIPWDETAICSDNKEFAGKGERSTGCDFSAAPNIDHKNPRVRHDLKMWLKWLRNKVGFEAIRFDFAKGYAAKYAGEYIEAFQPEFSIGEFWDSMAYEGSRMRSNQDAHRQRTVDWIDGTGAPTAAFDFTTKGILQEACANGEWWRLKDSRGKPPGVLGLWPARAVTFLDNHDTGSTQAHWPFPQDHLIKGYAYILTHPGVPTIFWDHVFENGSHQRKMIQALAAARRRAGVVSDTPMRILAAEARVGYAAEVGDRLCVWLGDSHGTEPALAPGAPELKPFSPGKDWGSPCVQGEGFKVWVRDTPVPSAGAASAR